MKQVLKKQITPEMSRAIKEKIAQIDQEREASLKGWPSTRDTFNQHGGNWFENAFYENVERPYLESMEYRRDEAYLANQE